MSTQRPEESAGSLPPDVEEALAEILADALLADLLKYPPPFDQTPKPPVERPGTPHSP